MLCSNCITLSVQYLKKKCVKCQGDTLNNLSVLCDTCSNLGGVCAICLKKINNAVTKKIGGCGCGKK